MQTKKADRPKHLGRGLESLLGPIRSATEQHAGVAARQTAELEFPSDPQLRAGADQIDIAAISANPYQARTVWSKDDLAELCDSIKANGVIQPVIVRRAAGGFQLIAGERRLRAAKLAGLRAIPAVVRDVTDEQLFEWSLVENIHRRDLNPIERARAYRRYLDAFSLSQTEAAERLGEDRSVVANHLRLLDLPHEIREMLTDGRLTMGHARAMLALPSDEMRLSLAKRALAGRLSVREVERLVRLYLTESKQPQSTPVPRLPHITELEGEMAKQLGLRVRIQTRGNAQKGRIVIEFRSLDEFDRVAERMGLRSGGGL